MSTRSARQVHGFTLVEMIIAIVVIGVGLAGVLAAFNVNVRSSVDPLVRKQMLAVAEEILEEILLKPHAVTGAAPTNALVACGTAGAVRTAFNDVRDYANYATTGICDIDGNAVAGLGVYNLSVATNAAASLTNGTTAVTAIRVAVTVTRGAEALTLVGWRSDYGS
jgi:MSHA pilin protein MshD